MRVLSLLARRSKYSTSRSRLYPRTQHASQEYHLRQLLFIPICTFLSSSAYIQMLTAHSVSPSIYIIIPAVSAGNAHQRVGEAHYSVTISVAPGELSTIDGQNAATRSYNFADLPCPPSAVASRDSWFYNPAYNPGRPYEPRISIPAEVTALDPAWSSCTATAQYQGFDPPMPLPTATLVNGPEGPSRRLRRGEANPWQPPAYGNRPVANLVPPTTSPTATTTVGPISEQFGPPGRLRRAAWSSPTPASALTGIEPGQFAEPIGLEHATVMDGAELQFGPPGVLPRAAEQDDVETRHPEVTHQPTKTIISYY